MTTHDNAPPPSDWSPEARSLRILVDGCEGCGISTLACEAKEHVHLSPCCGRCDHETSPGGAAGR